MDRHNFMLETSSEDDEHSDNEYPPRRNKIFRERINFDVFAAFEFKERFRVGSGEAEFILNKIVQHLLHNTTHNKALSPREQLLTALHWLGNGGQYHVTSDAHGLSKATVCRAIRRVVDSIVNHMFQDVVKWPHDNIDLAAKFMAIAGFPNVGGLVDGSLIKIDAPNENEAASVDRNGNHSINALFVCGPDYTFYFVSARWPGAVHDSRVLRNTQLCVRFDNGWRPFPDAVILGDSGYGLKEWLIPPLNDDPNDPAEQRFNLAHRSTRQKVECSIGILKERFPCLNHLRVSPEFAGKIIRSCAAIHNVASKEDFHYASNVPQNFGVINPNNGQAHNAPHTPQAMARQEMLLDFFA